MAVKKMRLDKYLVHVGIGSRSEVQKLIKHKKVQVDGVVVSKPETGIVAGEAKVTMGTQEIAYQEYYHFIMNKPAGVITATEDPRHETVLDLMERVDQNKEVAPVGRLDKDTEGLLVLTSDGQLNHQLLSPKKHVDKVYYAKVEGCVDVADQEAFEAGVAIGDYKCMPAKLDILTAGDVSEVHITIKEGKFHQVKRMMQAVGKEVVYLERIQMGGLKLPTDIPRGSYRPLTEEELKQLKGEE
ncbi:MAG: pseudouridine synthase [Cellulosilyticaceae bacterium]